MISQKYTFFLKNNSKIVLTSEQESEDLIRTKISKLLNSKKMMAFETQSDLLFINPIHIEAIHITKQENILTQKENIKITNKNKPTKIEEPVIEEDDMDYSDENDNELLEQEFNKKIDNSSILFSDVNIDEDNNEVDDNIENNDFESEQILENEFDDESIEE